MKTIYLDHAATTPLDPRVLEAMEPYFKSKYGNASSLHSLGMEAKKGLEESRATVANALNASPEEIVFTSGGTESDNISILGLAATKDKGHVITSKIEHHAVLHPCKQLEKLGFDVTYLPVTRQGLVELSKVAEAIQDDTFLISIMHANNEIGTIQPVKEIGALAHSKDIIFHTDAVQTFGKIPVDVEELNVDLLSISGHKLYGPKGVGALYVREGVKIQPIVHGGGHENKLRSGTENVPGIVGLAKATELAIKEMDSEIKHQTELRDKLIDELLKFDDCWLNGHPTKRLPGNVNVSFKYIEGESIILLLDDKGIAASTGSACSSKSLAASHVLTAMGYKPEEAHGSLRLTLGRDNTLQDIDYTLESLKEIVNKLRKISPFVK